MLLCSALLLWGAAQSPARASQYIEGLSKMILEVPAAERTQLQVTMLVMLVRHLPFFARMLRGNEWSSPQLEETCRHLRFFRCAASAYIFKKVGHLPPPSSLLTAADGPVL